MAKRKKGRRKKTMSASEQYQQETRQVRLHKETLDQLEVFRQNFIQMMTQDGRRVNPSYKFTNALLVDAAVDMAMLLFRPELCLIDRQKFLLKVNAALGEIAPELADDQREAVAELLTAQCSEVSPMRVDAPLLAMPPISKKVN